MRKSTNAFRKTKLKAGGSGCLVESKRHISQEGDRQIQSNGEYSFEYKRTTNIMDYSDFRNNLFYWQIKIVRSKAAPEPNNYRPEQL